MHHDHAQTHPAGAARRERVRLAAQETDQRRILELYGVPSSPGEASPVWMRGWKAAVGACYSWLMQRDPNHWPVSAQQLDDQLERVGLLEPEPLTFEATVLYRKVRELETALAHKSAAVALLEAELVVARYEGCPSWKRRPVVYFGAWNGEASRRGRHQHLSSLRPEGSSSRPFLPIKTAMTTQATPKGPGTMGIESMGHYTAIGMRTKVEDSAALVINTCSGNDTKERGDATHWTWANPTNRAVVQDYEDIEAVSTEALWQGTKMREGMDRPDPLVLAGDWRRAKGKKPVGAYAGPGQPLITTPGEARRRIYIPAFARQLMFWMEIDEEVADWLRAAEEHDGPVYLRDYDTGRGIDRNGPMSHAWLMATWLNEGDYLWAALEMAAYREEATA